MITKVGRAEIIDECVRLIKEGDIVAFPTETVYGLGGDTFNENAVKKIFEAKSRPSDNPFIVHVAGIDDINEVAFLTDKAKEIFEVFSPGPITIVLKKKPKVPYCVTAGLETVGVRIPSHPLGREFIKRCGVPICAPSANVSKKVSPTSAEFVYDDLNGKIPAIIDGGRCDVGIESTVLSLVDEPIILRPGAVTKEMLLPYLPNVRYYSGEIKVAPSPGMKYKHYAPSVPCVLFASIDSAIEEYELKKSQGINPVLLAEESLCEKFREKNFNVISLGENKQAFMHEIFYALRNAEKIYDYIIVQAVGENGLDYGIMNRLLKSSGGKII